MLPTVECSRECLRTVRSNPARGARNKPALSPARLTTPQENGSIPLGRRPEASRKVRASSRLVYQKSQVPSELREWVHSYREFRFLRVRRPTDSLVRGLKSRASLRAIRSTTFPYSGGISRSSSHSGLSRSASRSLPAPDCARSRMPSSTSALMLRAAASRMSVGTEM
jgi:hypothetical protein